jgi:hypothetical protein
MNEYLIEFSSLDWESPMEGVRHKIIADENKRLRLVEYFPTMPAHWCEKGHFGLILEGRLEVEFERGKYVFDQSAGVFIPDGHVHRHKARALSDVVRAIFVEDA